MRHVACCLLSHWNPMVTGRLSKTSNFSCLGVSILLLLLSGCSPISQVLRDGQCRIDAANPYDVLAVDLESQTIELFWHDATGHPFLSLDDVKAHLEERGDSVIALTNGGIYEPGFIPTGLLIQRGETMHPLNLDEGNGNFFLKPNGVFMLREDGARIVESSAVNPGDPAIVYATQSGPLLVREGEIHPAFTPGSKNCRLRSGVGVSTDGTVYLVISNGSTNFYDFAAFFRDTLNSPNALYLDGSISELYAPALGRTDQIGEQYAVILAVIPK